jgi:hypothetical protein
LIEIINLNQSIIIEKFEDYYYFAINDEVEIPKSKPSSLEPKSIGILWDSS